MQIDDITGNRMAVRARGITKCFDDVVALDAVDLDVVAGQIHGLVGPNGAGKTTLLGLLLGLAAALLTKPRLVVLDEPYNGLDPAGKKHVHGVLARLAADGAAVVLSSHRMDDLEALCSEVTIVSTGRVVFSGPLADASHELDYRLVTSDQQTARQVAAATPGIRVIDEAGARPDSEAWAVRALLPALDELVPRLVRAGIAVRGLTPVVSPLESAFLALTEQQESSRCP